MASFGTLAASIQALTCPSCGSNNIHCSGLSGEAVCEDCGTLVEGDSGGTLLVHRQLDEDDTTYHVGTQAVGKDGRTNVSMSKGKEVGKIKRETRDREAKSLLASLGRYFDASNVVDRANHFYLATVGNKPIAERSMTTLVTASFAVAMREKKRSETLEQICHFVGLKKMPVTRMYLKLQRNLGVKLSETDPGVFIEQLLLHLSHIVDDPSNALTLGTWMKVARGGKPGTLDILRMTDLKEVRTTALALADWVHTLDLFVGRHAVSVAVGIVLMAIEGARRAKLPKAVDISDELSKLHNVSSWTSMERYREIARAILDWSEQLPGVDLSLREYKVNERTGWRDRGKCKRKEVAELVREVLEHEDDLRAQRLALGLAIGGGGGSTSTGLALPTLTLAEFLQREQAAGTGSTDIGAWGAKAAAEGAVTPLATWDELVEDEETVSVAPAAFDEAAPGSAGTAAVEVDVTPVAQNSVLQLHGIPSAQSEVVTVSQPLQLTPSRGPSSTPSLPAAYPAPASAIFDMNDLLNSPMSSTHDRDIIPALPSEVDLAHRPYTEHGLFGSEGMALGGGANNVEINPALLAEHEAPAQVSIASGNMPSLLAATQRTESVVRAPFSPSAVSDLSPTGGPQSLPDPQSAGLVRMPPSSASITSQAPFNDATAPLSVPRFTAVAGSVKGVRPTAYMRYRPPVTLRQRSRWLKPDVVEAVRAAGNNTTALGQLLCAGFKVDDLPDHIAPMSSIGALAALRPGGAADVADDELFNDGELEALIRGDDEREFLLSMWEKDGKLQEMQDADATAAKREQLAREKDARVKQRNERKGSKTYSGSRRTKARQDLSADAIRLLIEQSGADGSDPEQRAVEDPADADHTGLDALALQYGHDGPENASVASHDGPSRPLLASAMSSSHEDDDSEDNTASDADSVVAASSSAGVAKRGRSTDVGQEQAEWERLSKRARVLYGEEDDDE